MTLAHAHVLELRHIATGDTGDGLARDSTRYADLVDCGLVTWDVGAGKDETGLWVRLRPGAVVVTPAGHAALRFYDLGRERMASDEMAKAVKK